MCPRPCAALLPFVSLSLSLSFRTAGRTGPETSALPLLVRSFGPKRELLCRVVHLRYWVFEFGDFGYSLLACRGAREQGRFLWVTIGPHLALSQPLQGSSRLWGGQVRGAGCGSPSL